MTDLSRALAEEARTQDAIFYADTLTAFTQASLAAWREQEAAEKQRRAEMMAHWLEHVWTKLETEE